MQKVLAANKLAETVTWKRSSPRNSERSVPSIDKLLCVAPHSSIAVTSPKKEMHYIHTCHKYTMEDQRSYDILPIEASIMYRKCSHQRNLVDCYSIIFLSQRRASSCLNLDIRFFQIDLSIDIKSKLLPIFSETEFMSQAETISLHRDQAPKS